MTKKKTDNHGNESTMQYDINFKFIIVIIIYKNN